MRFYLDDAKQWLPHYTARRLSELERGRMGKKGQFVVTSSRHRTQEQNLADCYDKIHAMLVAASQTPSDASEAQKERVAELQKLAKESRRRQKTHKSDKSRARRDRKSGKAFRM